jgi:hypothetical protein
MLPILPGQNISHSLMDEQRVQPFRDLQACDLNRHSMQDEIDSRGYVLLRGLLPQDAVNSLLGEITQILYATLTATSVCHCRKAPCSSPVRLTVPAIT